MGSLQSLKSDQKQALLTGIILVIAAFLRIYQLGQECLWVDEVSSVDQALRPLPELFFGFIRAPLYYFLLRCWVRISGLAEFWLRFPSAILGIASVYLTYRIGKSIFNRFVGQVSALLLAVSAFHIFYSQEVRHYSLWVFLTLWSNFFLLRILKKENSNKLYVFYGISAVLCLYTVQWSVLMLMIHNLVFFCFRKHNPKQWIITQGAVMAGFLVWAVPFGAALIKMKETMPLWGLGWIMPVSGRSLAAAFKTIVCSGIYFGAARDPDMAISFSQAGQMYVFLILCVLSLGGIDLKKTKHFFLLSWVLLPLAAILLVSWVAFPLFSERYLIFIVPGFLILAGAGIARFKRRLPRIALVALIISLNFPNLIHYYAQDQKPRYDRAVQIIGRDAAASAEVNIVINSCPETLVLAYYWEKNADSRGEFSLEIRREIGYKLVEGGIVYNGKGYNLIIAGNKEQLDRFVENGLFSSLPEVWLV
ncbi:MAG: glycosyltransferase family 39 protein, partial [Candidatus Omnitrophica bacterium]|nr:glycosyltransferase family 39 protein [Candidatus Omnitrophota bacterium]